MEKIIVHVAVITLRVTFREMTLFTTSQEALTLTFQGENHFLLIRL